VKTLSRGKRNADVGPKEEPEEAISLRSREKENCHGKKEEKGSEKIGDLVKKFRKYSTKKEYINLGGKKASESSSTQDQKKEGDRKNSQEKRTRDSGGKRSDITAFQLKTLLAKQRRERGKEKRSLQRKKARGQTTSNKRVRRIDNPGGETTKLRVKGKEDGNNPEKSLTQKRVLPAKSSHALRASTFILKKK